MKYHMFLLVFLGPCLAICHIIPRTDGPALTSSASVLPATTTDPAFIGSYFDFSLPGFSSWACSPDSTWRTIGTIGACCKTDGRDCILGFGCTNTSVVLASGRHVTCTDGTGSQTVCVTGAIVDKLEPGASTWMNYGCWPTWVGGDWVATRTIGSEVTVTVTASAGGLSKAGTGGVAAGAIAGALLCIAVGFFICGWRVRVVRKKRERSGPQGIVTWPSVNRPRANSPGLIVVEEEKAERPQQQGYQNDAATGGGGGGGGGDAYMQGANEFQNGAGANVQQPRQVYLPANAPVQQYHYVQAAAGPAQAPGDLNQASYANQHYHPGNVGGSAYPQAAGGLAGLDPGQLGQEASRAFSNQDYQTSPEEMHPDQPLGRRESEAQGEPGELPAGTVRPLEDSTSYPTAPLRVHRFLGPTGRRNTAPAGHGGGSGHDRRRESNSTSNSNSGESRPEGIAEEEPLMEASSGRRPARPDA